MSKVHELLSTDGRNSRGAVLRCTAEPPPSHRLVLWTLLSGHELQMSSTAQALISA